MTNHKAICAAIAAIIVGLIMCFTGSQLGPVAPIIISEGIYLIMFSLLFLLLLGFTEVYKKLINRKRIKHIP